MKQLPVFYVLVSMYALSCYLDALKVTRLTCARRVTSDAKMYKITGAGVKYCS